MSTMHRDCARRRLVAMPLSALFAPADDPALTLLLAIIRLAHRDARSRKPELAEPAREWLREMESEAMEVRR
jgi:hypothetical protein